MELGEFIGKQTAIIEPVETASHLAWWNLATTGNKEYAQQFQKAQVELRNIFSSPDGYQFLRSHLHDKNPFLNRQSQLLLDSFTENQIPPDMIEKIVALETEIESIYTNFRPLIDGKPISNNELKEIFVESTDSKKREEAWGASKKIAEQVEEKINELIKLRNECANKVGFSNFYSMRLKLQELDEKRLFELLEQLYQATNPIWEKYKVNLDETLSKKYEIKLKELMPWHYQDPFFQEAPQQDFNVDQFYNGKDIVEISRQFYESIGLPVEDILEKSDLIEREGKSQHAFCMCIDKKQDIRILCNIRDKEYWMSTQLHELGHAVYDKYIDQSLPYFLRTYAHISMTESIAMLFGRFSKNGKFLQQYCDVDPRTAEEVNKKGRQQTAATLLVFTRWTMVMIHFERAMYQSKGEPLNKLWWDLVEKFQGVQRVPGRDKPDWASKLHLACAPVYYQNYILGEMIASQLAHSIQVHVPSTDGCFSPEAGLWLKEKLFHLGAKYPWETTLEKVTKESLNPNYFVNDIRN